MVMDPKFSDIPDELWAIVQPLLPVRPPRTKGGRPPAGDRLVFEGIVYRLRTGCQWKALPSRFPSGSTCHRRFSQWTKAGVFQTVWKATLEFYDSAQGIDWQWSSMDSASVKAPKGGATQERIPRIAANWARNGTFSAMVAVYRFR